MAASLKDRYTWREVTAPQVWSPKVIGDELVGFYGGRTLRNGSYGQYDVVLVCVVIGASERTYMVSGTSLIQLVDAASLSTGDPIRIVFRGFYTTTAGHKCKDFGLLVAAGEVQVQDAPAAPEEEAKCVN